MTVLHSRIFKAFPDVHHGTATLAYQPLAFHGKKPAAVAAARGRFLRRVGIPLAELTLARQVHGTRVHIVTDPEQGSGASHPKNYLLAADALLTQRPNIALGVFTADCTPLLLHDPVTGWIGTVHAGWKGVVRGIVSKTLATLQAQGVRLSDVRFWLGPSICARCFTSADSAWAKQFDLFGRGMVTKKNDRYHVDLPKIIHNQLRAAGVQQDNIDISTACTKTSKLLPSARRQGPSHPNTLTVIARHAAPHDLRGKRVTIFGLGLLGGGVASVRYAVAQHAQVTVVDAQPARALQKSVAELKGLPVRYHFGHSQLKPLPKADVVVVNPGVRPDHPALRRAKNAGAVITTDLALFRAASTNPIIAVTGTKGKTTVATWIAHLLHKQRAVLAGNVQKSPLDLPAAFDGQTPVVLEVSSFQLEHLDVPLAPALGIITNLYPDHLNRHGTMRAYAKVKAAMLVGATGPIILPLDSDWKKYAAKKTALHSYWTADHPVTRAHAWLQDGWVMLQQGKRITRLLATAALQNQDQATQRNAVTVTLAGSLLGLPLAHIRKGLRTFRGAPQRFEVVRRYKGRTFINSTTATNPISAITALASVRGRCIVLAGGSSKKLPMASFAAALRKRDARVILFSGSATNEFKHSLPAATPVVQTMAAAVRLAWQQSAPGDTILLAPGAASFGLFRNEFDRGEQFVRHVTNLR